MTSKAEKAPSFLQKIKNTINSPAQVVFAILIPCVLYIIFLTSIEAQKEYAYMKNKVSKDYEWPELSDFKMAALSTATLLVLQQVFVALFKPFIRPIAKD